MLRRARALGRDVRVVLFEPKRFPTDLNPCAGVLSPPFGRLLASLGLKLPEELVQRRISAYVLHGDNASLRLADQPGATEATLTVDRAALDAFMLRSSEEAGVEVRREAVVDIRPGPDGILVATESGTETSAHVVVSAFGLTAGALQMLEQRSPFRRPPLMRSVLVDYELPDEEVEQRVGNEIHALLLTKTPRAEFAALTPKRGRITVNVAGRGVGEAELRVVLEHFQNLGLLPRELPENQLLYNVFPAGRARGIFTDRIVAVGNTSGMMRPLKGKGINSGILTGIRAAWVITQDGVSERALRRYHDLCRDINSDYYYGLLLRSLLHLTKRLGLLETVVDLARREARLHKAFYDMVSGEGTYHNVVREMASPSLFLHLAEAIARRERNLSSGAADRA